MLRIRRYCLQVAAIAAGLAVNALPAAAISLEDVQKLCTDYIENHFGEPDREQACLDAMRELESQLPAADPVTQRQAPPAIAPALIAVAQNPHDGDRDSIVQKLRSGETVDILIEFDVQNVRVEANARAIDKKLRSLSEDELEYKRAGYAGVKEDGLAGLQGITVLREYDNLASSFVRVSSEAALSALLERPEIIAVYENTPLVKFLNESLPLIQQPAVAAMGFGGAGTTIAVLDSGVDFTAAPFNCTSPGIPAGCPVAATFEAATNDFSLDDDPVLHGTNVSSIIVGTAGDADIVVADVFDGALAFPQDIQAAIDWAIAIQGTFNIVAVNLSLGTPDFRTTIPCPTHALAFPMADALAAGIQPIIASGNGAFSLGPYVDGIAAPACAPGAVSVGAVYDANVGQVGAGSCTDLTTTADQLACFSQSAPILSLLAPGAFITAGPGPSLGGTSQASPHVAGAWAVLRAIAPAGIPQTQVLSAMQVTGDPILDSRPAGGRMTSRLNLLPEPGFGVLMAVGTMGLVGLTRRKRRLG